MHRGRKKLKQVINNNNQKASIGRAAQQQCYELKLLLGTRSRNRLMSVRLSLLFSLGFPVPFWLEDRVGEDLVGEGAGEEDADNAVSRCARLFVISLKSRCVLMSSSTLVNSSRENPALIKMFMRSSGPSFRIRFHCRLAILANRISSNSSTVVTSYDCASHSISIGGPPSATDGLSPSVMGCSLISTESKVTAVPSEQLLLLPVLL